MIRREINIAANHKFKDTRIIIVLGVLTTVIVIARLMSRKLQKARWNASDYTIVLSLVGCWALTALNIVGTIFQSRGKAHIG